MKHRRGRALVFRWLPAGKNRYLVYFLLALVCDCVAFKEVDADSMEGRGVYLKGSRLATAFSSDKLADPFSDALMLSGITQDWLPSTHCLGSCPKNSS
jgi:hypothetical protein